MISAKEAAKLFMGKGALTGDMMRSIIQEYTGELLPRKRVQTIKYSIERASYIETKRFKVGDQVVIEVIDIGIKKYNEKKRQTNKLKAHFRKHGRTHKYRYYAEMFGVSTGCAYQCWRDVKNEMPSDLYKPDDKMQLINRIFT